MGLMGMHHVFIQMVLVYKYINAVSQDALKLDGGLDYDTMMIAVKGDGERREGRRGEPCKERTMPKLNYGLNTR